MAVAIGRVPVAGRVLACVGAVALCVARPPPGKPLVGEVVRLRSVEAGHGWYEVAEVVVGGAGRRLAVDQFAEHRPGEHVVPVPVAVQCAEAVEAPRPIQQVTCFARPRRTVIAPLRFLRRRLGDPCRSRGCGCARCWGRCGLRSWGRGFRGRGHRAGRGDRQLPPNPQVPAVVIDPRVGLQQPRGRDAELLGDPPAHIPRLYDVGRRPSPLRCRWRGGWRLG